MGRAASKAGAGGRAGACRRGAASRGATFFFCSRVDGLAPHRPLAQHSCFFGPSRVSRARPRVRQRTLTHPSAHAIARPPVPHHGRRRAQRQRQAAGRGERGGEREARAWEKCERGGGSKGATTPPSLSAHREAAPRPTCPPPGRVIRFGAGWDRWLRVVGARPSPLPPPAPAAFVFCLRLRPGAPPSRRARELRRWQPRVFSFLLGGGSPLHVRPSRRRPLSTCLTRVRGWWQPLIWGKRGGAGGVAHATRPRGAAGGERNATTGPPLPLSAAAFAFISLTRSLSLPPRPPHTNRNAGPRRPPCARKVRERKGV